MSLAIFVLNTFTIGLFAYLRPLELPIYMIVAFIVTIFLVMSLITKYMPVVKANHDDISPFRPTRIQIEKTEDINENIRRYKEAQSNAVYLGDNEKQIDSTKRTSRK